jgi:bacillithiol synthase
VVLRPLYQQRILPNLAYIGGPAEIAYWMEYKAMFLNHSIFFPILIPRNFVMLFDKGVSERMEKLQLSKKEIFTETEALVKSFVSRNSGESLDISREEEQLKRLYEELGAKAEKIDPTLKGAIEAELQKQLNALKNIQGKLLRAEKQRQEASVNQVRKTKEKLFPNGSLQERYDNFIPYYAKYGKGFLQLLKENLDPLDFKMLLLDLE